MWNGKLAEDSGSAVQRVEFGCKQGQMVGSLQSVSCCGCRLSYLASFLFCIALPGQAAILLAAFVGG